MIRAVTNTDLANTNMYLNIAEMNTNKCEYEYSPFKWLVKLDNNAFLLHFSNHCQYFFNGDAL